MRHFMAQFGPALQWPWTKLMDVPELTDELVERLVAQSDAQAAGRIVRELEAHCATTASSRSAGAAHARRGAGAVLDDYERGAARRAGAKVGHADDGDSQPLGCTARGTARVGRLQRAHAQRAAISRCRRMRRTRCCGASGWTRSTSRRRQLLHRRDAHLAISTRRGPAIGCVETTQVLGHDEKRLHVFTRCTGATTTRCWPRASRCCCTSTRRRASRAGLRGGARAGAGARRGAQ